MPLNPFKFFSLKSEEAVLHFYQELSQKPLQWSALAVNRKNLEGTPFTKELEIKTGTETFHLSVALKENGLTHTVFKNGLKCGKGTFAEENSVNEKFNSQIERIFETNLFRFQKGLIIDQEKTFSPNEVTTEDRALEWIRTSNTLLEKAVIESFTNKDLLFQMTFFAGFNSTLNRTEMRLILFNLDISYELLPNGKLRIRIFNDKNAEYGSVKKASLEGDFDFRKREMLDEFTRLLSLLSPGIKIHGV